MRRWPRLVGAAMGLALMAGAGTAGGLALSAPGTRASGPALAGGRRVPGPAPGAARLVAYDGCSQLLAQVRAEALRELAAAGGSPAGGGAGMGEVGAPVLFPAASAAAAAGTDSSGAATGAAPSGVAPDMAAGPAPTFSTTNDQEPGVDEPDLVKTDGRLLASLRRSTDTLELASVAGAPSLLGSLALGSLVQATGLLLVGSDVVVLGSAPASTVSPPLPPPLPSPSPSLPSIPLPAGPPASAAGAGGPAGVVAVASPAQDSEVVVVDVSDPAHPAVARSFTVQGTLVDARLIGGVVEVVVASSPTLPFASPAPGAAAQAAGALAADRLAVERSTVAQWLPSVTSEPSGTTTTAPCTSVMHSTGSSTGLDTIGVVPIDPTSDQPGPETTVMGDASAVYASATRLYVAYSGPPASTPPGGPLTPAPASSQNTTVDAFDLSKPQSPTYLGTAVVAGTLLGPYAMSEYQGDLRVATTVGTPTPAPGDGSAPAVLSDNRVTVLGVQAGTMPVVGQITGLGAGEQIYAVRFEGPLGYVVTFQQTDPLYVVDLSDPAHPTLAGQLPLDGYSSFLEPLGGGLLLGVGQAVDSTLRPGGLQVSLFDVSDPASPALLDKVVVADASSDAETDPHALLYWAPTDLVVMPADEWGGTAPFSGALAFQLRGHSLGSAIPISQPPPPAPGGTTSAGTAGVGGTSAGWSATAGAPYPSPDVEVAPVGIERALVVGGMLYTVSESGILASDLGTLAPLGWLPWS